MRIGMEKEMILCYNQTISYSRMPVWKWQQLTLQESSAAMDRPATVTPKKKHEVSNFIYLFSLERMNVSSLSSIYIRGLGFNNNQIFPETE